MLIKSAFLKQNFIHINLKNRQLLNLDKLDLTDNNLKDVPSSAMTAIPQLRELQLSQNSIRKIKSFAFSYLSELIKLGQYKYL